MATVDRRRVRNVLIVSPRFPPINAPDHQRVRMALPYLRDLGWQPTVLCVDSKFIESHKDSFLLKSIPHGIRTLRSKAIPFQLTRRMGFGGLTWRAKSFLKRDGCRLLAQNHFDLVYFSTTEFDVLPLGIDWKRRFGIPFIVDIQDPWVNDYYRQNGVRPPGGWFKYGLTQFLAKIQEPRTLAGAAHITVVSPRYKENLLAKYSFLEPDNITVLPFGGPESDFAMLDRLASFQTEQRVGSGKMEWLYVGRAGVDMQYSLRAFFVALRRAIDEQLVDPKQLRVRFIGTDYATGSRARKWTESLAAEAGVERMVEEQPSRIPYFEALNRLRKADALIVPGSDDPGYTASKIYPYILAG